MSAGQKPAQSGSEVPSWASCLNRRCGCAPGTGCAVERSLNGGRVDAVATAVKKAAHEVSGERPAEHGRESGVRHEFTVPGVRIVVEAI